jgi:transcriptional regulator with XRE-family HTH domain
MLGERIRKLRKQKKMTLEALAGSELTKGMLSLIENNKANPSMESLSYIAEQLEVELSDLLEVISTQELGELLEEAENIYNNQTEKKDDKHKKLIMLIEPHVNHFSQGYQAARLLELYSYSLAHENNPGWQDVSDKAAQMFDQMNITANRATIGIFQAQRQFINHEYTKALEVFLIERKNIESNHPFIDPMTKLNLDYHEAVLYFAVGDSESATNVMENALHFSKEKRIFYLIDDLYRLAAGQAMMSQNEIKREYYTKKLKQYGEFADHRQSIMFCKLLDIMSLISEKHEYNKALEEINQLFTQPVDKDFYEPWFNLGKGRVLYYLGRYEEALQFLNKVEIPSIHHPFDLSIFYVMDSYKALTYLELGNGKEALLFAETAVKNFEPLFATPFKAFSLETYFKIKNEVGTL